MPKQKTHKSLLKRVELTAQGKLRARKMSVAHRARFKSKRALNAVGHKQVLASGFAKKLKKTLGI